MKGVGEIKSRTIHGNKDGVEFWKLYKSILVQPRVQKEVIIVTGDLFYKEKLIEEFNKPEIKDTSTEAIQLVYLSRSTWTAVTIMGTSLKILAY